MRSAETVLGIIHDRGKSAVVADTGEPGAPESRVLRKAQARFGEGRLEKCRQRQLASRLLYIVVGFEHEADARRFGEAMRERLQEFALSLHPDKTRLLEFGRFAVANRKRRGLGKPETFTFLGFTFICGRTRRGDFQIHRKTRRDRMQAKLTEIKEELRRRMHQPIPHQGRWLRQVVTGYYNYYAVPTNSRALEAFHDHVIDLWRRTLRRRSQKDGSTWE